MPNRTERRAAERAARKLAAKQLREEQVTEPVAATAVAVPTSAKPAIISASQLLANQQNARLSSGPVSIEGKAISARNNTRHGLTADCSPEAFRVLPTEDQNAYIQDLAAFRAEWKPATATEHDLVNRMVMHQWLRRRALRLQEALFHPETGDVVDSKKFELYRRYETSHERGFNKAFSDIQRLRSFQSRERNGFKSQQRKNQEHAYKMRRFQEAENRKVGSPKPLSPAPVNAQPENVTVTAP